LQHVVRDIEISEPLLVYINQLARNTRPGDSQSSAVNQYVQWGAGPRAGQAMVLCAKANALLSKRFAVTMQDIKQVAHGVLRHRLLLSFQAQAQNISSDDVVDSLLQDLAEPASPFAASV
jgi:MoxR-like ATPase